MKFLEEGSRTIKADEKYEHIYTKLNEKTGLKIQDIFFLCVVLGYKNQRTSSDFQVGKKELRVTYLSETQRSILYAIGGNLEEINILQNPTDKDAIAKVIREYQKYSNGGMEILIERVLKNNFNGNQLSDSYANYDVDLLKFVYSELSAIPF
ncbi:hypothetical protein [Jeotgalibaca sp. A122]|uniref:hypothetical protein n=1 Tax=Jeotgalibaca sp. A122 TaxID=3457322 RepID=UPI003FD130C4